MLTNPPCDPLPRARGAHARPWRRRPRPPRAASPPPPRDRCAQRSAAACVRPARGPRAVSARLRLAPPAPRRAPAGGPRSTKKPIPLFARRAPSGHRAPQKAPSVPTAAPRRAAGWGGAQGGGGRRGGQRRRGARRAAGGAHLVLGLDVERAPRSAAPRPPRAHSPLPCGAPSAASRRATPRRGPCAPTGPPPPPPARSCARTTRAAAQLPRAPAPACARPPARRKPPPDSPDLWIPALQSLRTRTRTRPCAAVRTPPVLCAPPAPRPLLLCSSPAPRSAPSVTVTASPKSQNV